LASAIVFNAYFFDSEFVVIVVKTLRIEFKVHKFIGTPESCI